MDEFTSKKYALADVTCGMQIARDVYSDDGQVILNQGTILSENLIAGLEYWEVPYVYVQEKAATVPVQSLEPVTSPAQQQFCQQYDKTLDTLKTGFSKIKHFKEIPLLKMQELVHSTLTSLIDMVGVMNHLHMVQRHDEYTFHHSINVAVISGMLGKWSGYDEYAVKELMLAGLLHDIGKLQIPDAILNKPGDLSPEERQIAQTHAALSYQLLKPLTRLPQDILYGILQHHERMDGKGYPLRLKASQIHPYAKIIAIADTYDAMTSDRVYRQKATPFQVAETMIQEMFGKLDPELCNIFLNNVRDYFVGNSVRLSDNRVAEVVYLGGSVGSRPTVRTHAGEFIDLEKHKEISIVELLKA